MNKRAYVPAIALGTIFLDLVTKYMADTMVKPYEPVEVLPFFNLVNVENTGAAFSMLSSLGNGFFITVALLAILFILYLLVRTDESPVPLALILGGAVGNLTDRLYYGHVRDFLDFHVAGWHWPAFNVADSALTVGLAILLALALFPARRRQTGPPDTV
jgi:signal peptidase II